MERNDKCEWIAKFVIGAQWRNLAKAEKLIARWEANNIA